jgi:glycogen operon protein
MLLGGDELGRTQQGNNNAYCQDSEISWFDWRLSDADRALLDFSRHLIGVFRSHPVLRRRRFFQGRRIRGSSVKDLTWFGADGREMTDEQWQAPGVNAIGLRLAGDAIDERGERGERVVDDTLLWLLNAGEEAIEVPLPNPRRAAWHLLLDTARPEVPSADDGTAVDGTSYRLAGRSTVLLRLPRS